MTSGQFIALLDAAYDRQRAETRGQQIARTEAVRVGVAAAMDRRAANAWRRAVSREQAPSRALNDKQLEQAIQRIAQEFPGHVVYGATP